MNTHQPNPTPNPQSKGGRGVAVIAGIALVALVAAGVIPRIKQQNKLDADSKEAATESSVFLVTSPHLAATEDLVLPANVRAIEETVLGARSTGYLRKRYVDIGTRVKAGQVLAEIESPDVDQQLLQAQADQAKSVAAVGQTQADVAQKQAGVVQSQADVAKAIAAVAQAKAVEAGSVAKLSQSKAALSGAQARVGQKRQALDLQKSSLAQAQAQLTLATINAKRSNNLLQKGFVAQAEVDQANATLSTTTAGVAAAQSSVRSAQADIDSALQDVEAAKAAVHSAESDVAASKESVSSANAAADAARAELAAAKANVGASEANVNASRAQVQSSSANTRRYAVLQSFSKIVAPFDGVITSRNADVGALIGSTATSSDNSAGTSKGGLFGIARVDTLRIQVSVPQTNFRDVHPGTKVQIAVKELPGQTFEGVVFENAGALDASSRTLLTEVRVVNKTNQLLPGMYAQVTFKASSVKSLRIPANTLIVDASGSRVAMVGADSKVHMQPVTIGRDYGNELEIVAGLKGTEKLITNPPDSLAEGQAVKTQDAPVTPAKK